MTSTRGSIDYEIPSEWNGGFIGWVHFRPYDDIGSWRIELTYDGDITNIWDAQILEHTGNTYVIGNLDGRGDLDIGERATFGFQAAGPASSELLFLENGEPPEPPEISVLGGTAIEGDPGAQETTGSVMGPLETSGNGIFNAAGERVQIEAANWFGLETTTHTPHGLWLRNWQEMMNEIKATGFNAIRLPFSLEALIDPDAMPSGIDYAKNADLVGLDGLEILDKVVGYAEEIGLGIILDNHRSEGGSGPNDNGLWYDSGYTEADWIDTWVMLAKRYGDSPAIIGADLVNEPHSAEWDAWASAAERAGNAILAETDKWLIIVEGVGQYEGNHYWWGGNLEGVIDRPVVLSASDKLVYSPHDYPPSVYDQTWFHDGSDLAEVFRTHWGYIHENGIAPILLGEFGSRLATDVDRAWAEAIVSYLGGDLDGDGTVDAPEMNFAWWSWNPNSSDTGGILEDDWRTLRAEAVDLLAPLLADDGGGAAPSVVHFTVSLSDASPTPVTVRYATADRTAVAGKDYVATQGELVFAPGETQKHVNVTVLADTLNEGEEQFVLNVDGPEGRSRAVGTITDDDDGGPPQLSVADVRVVEGDGVATLTAMLSAPSDETIKLRYKTIDASAEAGEDYAARRGAVVFAPGETEKSIDIPLLDDDVPEANEILLVRLQVIGDATLADDRVRVMILNDDFAPATLHADDFWSV